MHRLRTFSLALSTVFLVACSGEPAGDDGAFDAGMDAGITADAGMDAGECPSASHRSDTGDCVSDVRWSDGPELPIGIHHHATFVATSDAGTWLYVAGGAKDSTSFNFGVARSQIQQDGSLSAWKGAPSLPRGFAGLSVAQVGDTVVLTGGLNSSLVYSTGTWLSTVQPDGNLAEWQAGPDLPEGRMHHATVSVGDDVYLVGGTGANGLIGTVHRARVTSPGVLSAWEEIGSLPEPRSHHSIAVSGRFLYLTGGLTDGPDSDVRQRDVLRAEVLEDGSIGEWSRIGTLPHSLSVHASFIRRGWLYLAGGLKDGTGPTDELLRAPLTEAGQVGEWEMVADPLPLMRAHVHQVPVVDERFLYSVGGMIAEDGTSTPQVFVGRFE